jgi:hypothetical protein
MEEIQDIKKKSSNLARSGTIVDRLKSELAQRGRNSLSSPGLVHVVMVYIPTACQGT